MAMAQWPNARDREFQLLLGETNLKDGLVVCDLPAGGGYLSRYMSDYNVIFHAIETSKYFFERCPKDRSHHRYLCELNALPLENASVDRVFSLAGLHHIQDRLPVYQEIARILKPYGYAVLADVAAGSAVDKFLNTFVDSKNSLGHEGLFIDQHDLMQMDQLELIVESDREIEYYWMFDSTNDMTAFIKSLFGLDLADSATILKGIDEYLGYEAHENTTLMCWALRFLRVRKPFHKGEVSDQRK